jgi:dTDP-4-dehydrorhamnose reductase
VAAVESRVREIRPQAIFNCAAYTNVDEAEDAGRKANFDVNALGVFYLATVAQKCGIDFVTVSTDYVFDGTREAGYDEDAVPNPINAYGLSKYLGETLARQACENAIVVRTSWLYG